MRISTSPIALLALPALAHAVALIDFVPRVSDVSTACGKVYEQSIPSCESKDFTQGFCSTSCVKGLDSMTKLVKEACGDDDLDDKNILAKFMEGSGPENLCENASDVLESLDSSSSASSTSSSTDSTTAEPSTTFIVSSTATASSGSVPTSLVMDTSSSAGSTSSEASATSTESSEPSASATSSETSQIFQAPSMPPTSSSSGANSEQTDDPGRSGGGSPFDAEGNQFSAAVATSSSIALVLAVAFAALAAQW